MAPRGDLILRQSDESQALMSWQVDRCLGDFFEGGIDRKRMARPRGETSNSSAAERLFAELVEWAEHLKDHALFRNVTPVRS